MSGNRRDRSGKRRGPLWISPQGGLFAGMALAGLIAVALTVTADRGNAGGIDGLRAIVPGRAAGAGVNVPPPVLPPPSPAPTPPSPAESSSSTGPGAAIGVSPVAPPPAAPPTTAPTPTTAVPATAPVAAPAPTAGLPAATPIPSAPASTVPTTTPAPTATPAPTPAPAPVALTTDRGATALVAFGDIVPGDSITRTLAVRNTGTSAFRYGVSATQTAGTLLWTDAIDGLQLTLRTPGGTVLYSGALSGLGTVAAPNVVAPGGSDDLVYVFSLPASASNVFQGLLQDLTIVLTAVQYP